MDTKIALRNMEPDRTLEAQVARKFDQVLRHIPAAEGPRVELTFEPTRSRQERYLAQLSFNVKGTVLRSEQRGSTAIDAVHGATNKLEQLASRFKGQVYRSQRTRNSVSVGELQAAEALEQDMELAREYVDEGSSALVQ